MARKTYAVIFTDGGWYTVSDATLTRFYGDSVPVAGRGLTQAQARKLLRQQAANAKTLSANWQSMDLSSGLGIGGHGSDDFNIGNTGPAFDVQPGPCRQSGTRYDEPCAHCGRITAICNDCELCSRCHP